MKMEIIIEVIILIIMTPLIIKSMNEEIKRLRIKPGHYKLKSFNEEGPQRIIRIIGEDKDNPGYWLDMSGNRYSDDELVKSYVALETFMSQEDAAKSTAKRKPLVIGDLPTVEERENNGEYDQTQPQHQHQQPSQQPQSQQPIQPQPIQDTIETQIINKCRSNNKTNINISLSFETNIDINGVIQTCSILNLNKEELARQLTQILINDNIQKAIETKIQNVIDGNETLETSQVIEKTSYTISELKQLFDEQRSFIEQTIKDSISEINVPILGQEDEDIHINTQDTQTPSEEQETPDMSDFLAGLDARLEQLETDNI